jgi:hypothetical protein
MAFTQEFLANPTGTLSGLGGAIALGGTAFKTIAKVPQGEVGLRTRFGRPARDHDARFANTTFEGVAGTLNPALVAREGELYGRVKPGFHLVVPFTHGIKSISVQNRVNNLEPIPIDNDDGRQREIVGRATWGVINDPKDGGEYIRRALYEAANEEQLTEEVIGICTAGLRKVIAEYGDPQRAEAGELYREMVVECKDPLEEYGTELRKFRLMSAAHTMVDALRYAGSGDPDHARRLGVAASHADLRVMRGNQ